MYSEHKGSQDKKIVVVSIRKGPWERRHGTKSRDEKKSATQEENHNTRSPKRPEVIEGDTATAFPRPPPSPSPALAHSSPPPTIIQEDACPRKYLQFSDALMLIFIP